MSGTDKIINFMGFKKIAIVLSSILLIVSITSLATKQLSFGLDFTGGTQIEVFYDEVTPLSDIRSTLAKDGFENAVVIHFGSERDILVRLPDGVEASLGIKKDAVGEALISSLTSGGSTDVELRRIEFVGPQVGDELREQGGLALLMALGVVMLYVAMRFQFKFSVGAVAALAHDVLIVLGVFSIFELDFDLTVLAALLAVIGYSLNDTIVVSDRIRENFRKLREGDAMEVINISLTQTSGRTLITSLTTAMVLLALFLIGGQLIHNFALALLVGVAVGTYSSIYVAANILLSMNISREDLIVITVDPDEIDDRP